MRTEIKFTNELTLEHLNPLNYALKNDYMSNLITTGLMLLPAIGRVVSLPVIVKRGMTSRNVMSSGRKPSNAIDSRYLDRFSQGLALSISWEGFEIHEAIEIAQGVMSELLENAVMLVNGTDKHLNFYRDTKEKAIYETNFDSPDNVRMIRKYV